MVRGIKEMRYAECRNSPKLTEEGHREAFDNHLGLLRTMTKNWCAVVWVQRRAVHHPSADIRRKVPESIRRLHLSIYH